MFFDRKKAKYNKQEKNLNSIHLRKDYILGMPQLFWGGLSENWLMKELGDAHWQLITQGYGIPSGELTDSSGDRLYASFVRIKWNSNVSLSHFKENEAIQLNSTLFAYGNKMLFSKGAVQHEQKQLEFEMMSVFSARSASDNTTLKKADPLAIKATTIPQEEAFPPFAQEYMEVKKERTEPVNAGLTEALENAVFSCSYDLEPVEDINGVGLLYFASYPKISDKCERKFFNQKSNHEWADMATTISRDVFYFGNANSGETLCYVLESYKEDAEQSVFMESSLFRTSDGKRIAWIRTVKERRSDAGIMDTLSVEEPAGRGAATTIHQSELEETILSFLQRYLNRSDLPKEADLKGLGIESIAYMELAETIAREYQITCKPSWFYGLFTVRDIAERLLNGSSQAEKENERNTVSSGLTGEEIAIVASSFRVPGAESEEAFWQLIEKGEIVVSQAPASRYGYTEKLDPDLPGLDQGGFLNAVDAFDAGFFSISPREALTMDPQQRLLLEQTWLLIENAGYATDVFRKQKTGVYIGASGSDYDFLVKEFADAPALSGTGTANAILANRLSYIFDLQGPSLQIDTACSSSLVAVHEAIKAIRAGDCEQAIVGAVNIICHPSRTKAYYASGMLSRDGKCHTFDQRANGYVRGEGCILFLLKPLKRALSDGDTIEGIIRASSVNHTGKSGGLTVPNPLQQQSLVEEAIARSGLGPSAISYIEAHGTGTPLGDPIEVNALLNVFRNTQNKTSRKIVLGSVKSNIGHLEAAAGMAGILKTLLCLNKKVVPPLAGFGKLNPEIDLEETPFFINAESYPLTTDHPNMPLRAGVSSFGIGGTNAHVILESGIKQEKKEGAEFSFPEKMFVLSARNEEALRIYAEAMRQFIHGNPAIDVARLTYTLQTARTAFEKRLAIKFTTVAELQKALADYIEARQGNPRLITAITENKIENQGLAGIAFDWCKGALVNWKDYWKGTPARIKMPGYPFQRKKYWIVPEPANSENERNALNDIKDIKPIGTMKQNEEDKAQINYGEVNALVRQELAEVLYLSDEELDMAKSFQEMGLDSVLGVEFMKRLGQRLNLSIPMTRLYDYPGINELTGFLVTESNGNKQTHLVAELPKIKLQNTLEERPVSQKIPDAMPLVKLSVLNHSQEMKTVNTTEHAAQQEAKNTNTTEIYPFLIEQLASVLYLNVSEIDETKTFNEMGLDSILGVELIKKLNQKLEVNLKVSVLYDYPTIKDLTTYLSNSAVRSQVPLIGQEEEVLMSSENPEKPMPELIQANTEQTIGMKADLLNMLGEVLYVSASEIDQSKTFSELGLDSILGVEFLKKVNNCYGLNLKASILYDYPCVQDFVGFVVSSAVPAAPPVRTEFIPLINYTEEPTGNDTRIFWFSTNATDLPFLHDHIVFDEMVLPTDAYIEMLDVVLRGAGTERELTIDNAIIHKPYKFGQGKLKLLLNPSEGKGYRYFFSSLTGGQETMHMRGFVATDTTTVSEKLRVNIAPERQYNTAELEAIVRGAELRGVYHRVRRSLVYGKKCGQGTLGIFSEEGMKVQGKMAQVLDGALLFCIQYGQIYHPQASESMWLPYRFKRINVKGTVENNVAYTCSFICTAEEAGNLLFDLEVTDEGGKALCVIQQLELRPVSNTAASGQKEEHDNAAKSTDVAIIGMACRYPDADNYHEFWSNLEKGHDAVRTIPAGKWATMNWFHPDRQNKNTSCSDQAAFINDSDKFDSLFFGISPSEAELMDPQQRVFLEETWKAFEDAACDPKKLARKKVGVFIGAGTGDYLQLMKESAAEKAGAVFTGTSSAILSGRISYYFNFTGPSFTLDTACSSSLVAVDRAWQSLVSGESDMAVAGGIALMTSPQLQIWTSQVGMSSADGRCKPFDDSANGIVSGEGAGVVILKRLEDALRDGDRIHAVIKGSAVNQDGKTNGITAPSARSQKELQQELYTKFAINPETISYVEAHGTGTKLGDPIEIDALTESFAGFTSEKSYCGIGSVKANIGHTSFSAGIGGLIKVVLMMKNGKYVPSLHCNKVNERIDFKNSPFFLCKTLTEWTPRYFAKRRAAINNFGFSGTNAHLVVEEYTPVKVVATYKPPYLFVLSAKTKEALKQMAGNLLLVLKAGVSELAEITYTLQVGREALRERLAFYCDTREEAILKLRDYINGSTDTVFSGTAKANQTISIYAGADKPMLENWLQQWVSGTEWDWQVLYKMGYPSKIALPSYPFARERYWFDSFAKVNEKPVPQHTYKEKRSAGEKYAWAEPGSSAGDNVVIEYLEEGVAWVKMKFAETRNMFTRSFVQGVQQAFLDLRKNKSLKVVVLSGYDDVFSMGGSLEELSEIASGRTRFTAFPFLYRGLLEFDVPVITAMQGHALGGGLVFGLYGDIVLMSESATYSANFMKYGFTPGMGATFILGEKLGKGLATEMMYTARLMSGAELKQRSAGVVVTADPLKQAITIARELAQKPRLALETLKNKMSAHLLEELDRHIAEEERMHELTFSDEVLTKIREQFVSPAEVQISKQTVHEDKVAVNPYKHSPVTINRKNETLAEQELKQILDEVLHIGSDRLDTDTPFVELGLDSISGVQVIRKINECFALHLETVVLYEHYTFKRLLSYILSQTKTEQPVLSIPELVVSKTPEPDNEIQVQNFINPQSGKMVLSPLTNYTNSQPAHKTEVKNTSGIVQKVEDILETILHVDKEKLRQDYSFVDLGLDSISGVQIVRLLNTAFQINIETIVLYEYHTLNTLSGFIASELGAPVVEEKKPEWTLPDICVKLTALSPEMSIKTDKPATVSHKSVPPPQVVKEKLSSEQKEAVSSCPPSAPDNKKLDVAVIGISGRFPGAEDLQAFWENIKNGVNSITEVAGKRWSSERYYSSVKDTPGKTYNKWMGCIDSVDRFDALFFNISPLEAERMDPQQRLLMEECWKTIEDAGYTPEHLASGKCGVYMGVSQGDYLYHLSDEMMDGNFMIGRETSVMAGRIAYYLNLKGPAISIDSACSSSLTSIHLACQGLISGDCDTALAGGVYIRTNEQVHIMSCEAGMLSDDGKCHTFDNSANGFVPGEGVGAVMLKKLEDAQRDGDHIYAVIKGSAINQDGKTNGITAPSYSSQTRLQKEVYDRFGIHPETIEYIEAHGTGTKLGDPIEVKALKQTFSDYTSKVNYCAIGSVKTNIGHTIIAAGVAGFLKALLALKHQQIPPSLHFEKLNEHIVLEGTPFYVNTKLKQWQTDSGKPRRAAISSFGISGTNAHMVLEEVSTVRTGIKERPYYLFPFSAKTPEALFEKLEQFRNWLDKNKNVNLEQMAFTLQLGRQRMDCRWLCVASSVHELQQQIEKSLNASEVVSPAMASYTDKCSSEDRELLAAWLKGEATDWMQLYKDGFPGRISLPVYPFARDRHWITVERTGNEQQEVSYLHPLVHKNSSSLKAVQFETTLLQNTWFFSEHLLNGQQVLPAAAILEWARKAMELATQGKVSGLKDVAWTQLVEAGKTPARYMMQILTERGEIGFRLLKFGNSSDDDHISVGALLPVTGNEKANATLRVNEIMNRLPEYANADQCYSFFEEKGLHYTNRFRKVTGLYFSKEEVVAQIKPDVDNAFEWDPAVLDMVFQSCVGFFLNKPHLNGLVPLSLKEMRVYDNLASATWVYVRPAANSDTAFDLTVTNANEQVIAEIKEFKVALSKSENVALKNKQALAPILTLEKPEWVPAVKQNTNVLPGDQEVIVLMAGFPVQTVEKVRELLELPIDYLAVENEYQVYKTVLKTIQSLLRNRTKVNVVFVFDERHEVECAFISGLLKTAAMEASGFRAKTLRLESAELNNPVQLAARIREEISIENEGEEVWWQNGRRLVRRLKALTETIRIDQSTMPLLEEGVYWITGGAGGLGLLFASYIAKAKNAKVILSGRSQLNAALKPQLEKWENVFYLMCDCTDKQSVADTFHYIRQSFGPLKGVIHSAGIHHDGLLMDKSEEEAINVLLPKIKGAQYLDDITRNEPLRFFALFSSIAGYHGNVGQGDYAAANAYLDAFSYYRNEEMRLGRRHGKTVSFNWPLWEEGGMQVDEQVRELLKRQSGMMPLPSDLGWVVFNACINAGVEQMLVNYRTIQEVMPRDTVETVRIVEPDTEWATDRIKAVLATELKIPVDRLKPETPFEAYGINSLLITKLTNRLSEHFERLPRTLFFECRNLNELMSYLKDNHRSQLELMVAGNRKIVSDATSKPVKVRSVSEAQAIINANVSNESDIAIIGLGGRYPGAQTLDEFWENLKEGRDSIVEVPADRWDVTAFYDAHPGTEGKSYSKWGGFMKDVDKFDPLFFNISPKEAELMDPQERLFLQTVWETVERAGYTRETINEKAKINGRKGYVGVFAGVMFEEYPYLGVEESVAGNFIHPGFSTGSIANRVSYFFDWHGPSFTINSMCSSSLTAIHMACESIRSGECKMAVAGGVNVSVHPAKYVALSRGRFVSSKGRCESFGEGAEGYVPGEGVGAVLLKSLKEAVNDGDTIWAVIKGSAVGHGGKNNGYNVPNPNAQSEVIALALEKSGLIPEAITYIETHGTGTKLGDPIEIAGLTKVFGKSKAGTIRIGSVKSNIGHAESAAGISGLTKLIFQLKHRLLVPSLHSSVLNADIDFSRTPFQVQQQLETWKQSGEALLTAGISSFGAGGSNAHLIVQEYKPVAQLNNKNVKDNDQVIIPLSARNSERLREVVVQLIDHLAARREDNLADVAFTLQSCREHFEERLACIVSSKTQLVNYLRNYLNGRNENVYLWNCMESAGMPVMPSVVNQIPDSWHQACLKWVKGDALDSGFKIDAVQANKLILPVYPFAKERYWISRPKSNVVREQLVPGIQNAELVFLEPAWITQEIRNNREAVEKQVVICFNEELRNRLSDVLPGIECIAIEASDVLLQSREVYACLDRLIKATVKTKVVILVHKTPTLLPTYFSGIFKTLQLGNFNLQGQVLQVAPELSVANCASLVIAEIKSDEMEVRYHSGQRQVKKLVASALMPTRDSVNSNVFREKGVYLITGGAGGLGRIFMEHIAAKHPSAKIILTGRTYLSLEKQDWTQRFPNVEYYSCDVSDKAALAKLLMQLNETHGAINGIIHSAGSAPTKNSKLFERLENDPGVLLPKLNGTVYLDELTQHLPLDFFVCFSSLSGTLDGIIGFEQSDYALANAFLDEFAQYRQVLVQQGRRYGKTLSINWPMWANSGMYEKEISVWLEKNWGLMTLPEQKGIEAFYSLWPTANSQGVVVYGNRERITKHLAYTPPAPAVLKSRNPQQLKEQVTTHLQETISQLLKIESRSVRMNQEFGQYGFDSVSMTAFAQLLNQFYELELMPTVFYNYPTLSKLSQFLLEHYPDQMNRKWSTASSVTTEEEGRQEAVAPQQTQYVNNQINGRDVAIIGMSGRFPGSPDIMAFWQNVLDNKDLVTEVPADRWDWQMVYGDPKTDSGKTQAKWGGFIKEHDCFDPLFFSISPREAELMDPQHRIALEVVYHAVEDAGINIKELSGTNTGVFIGSYFDDYFALIKKSSDVNEPQTITGISQSLLANRISYLFNLHGPSEPVDTACSSSLVAVHRAVQHIRMGLCNVVIAGGVSLDLIPESLLPMSQAGMLSKDGRCKAFDEQANGYVRGEGVGMIVLKSLEQAERDGDRIYAVIKATTQNHGGKANTLTSPNPSAQKDVLVQAYLQAEIHPSEVGYIEAHGTGTPLGDPIEVEGLKSAFDVLYKQTGTIASSAFCGIGSVKANIGHLESAAGIAGLIKSVMIVRTGLLPGNPQLKQANKYLQLEHSPFYLVKETTTWRGPADKKRVAGISSFGFGGVNAHVVLQEYKKEIPVETTALESPVLIVLSARNKGRLKEKVKQLLNFMTQHASVSMTDMAYTLQVGREPMEERLAFVAATYEEVIRKLNFYCTDNISGLATGNTNGQKESLLTGESVNGYVKYALQQRDWAVLAAAWVQGVEIDWRELYPLNRPSKIALPLYPFERQRYWLRTGQQRVNAPAVLNDLVHARATNQKHVYESHFSGSEPYFKDHLINDKVVVPAAAFLAMAGTAFRMEENNGALVFKRVKFHKPCILTNDSGKIRIGFDKTETGAIAFRLDSHADEPYCSGELGSYTESKKQSLPIENYKAGLLLEKNGEECYRRFAALGLNYGSYYQKIDTVYYNDKAALVKIKPVTENGMLIHPGVVDSILQAAIVFSKPGEERLRLPYFMDECVVYESFPQEVWGYVTNRSAADAQATVLDVDILDKTGNALAIIKGFTLFSADKEVTVNGSANLFLYTPSWMPGRQNLVAPDDAINVLVLVTTRAEQNQKLMEGVEIKWISPTTETDYYIAVKEILLQQLEHKQKVNVRLLLPEAEMAAYRCVSGLLRSAGHETSLLHSGIVFVPGMVSEWLNANSQIVLNEFRTWDQEVAYTRSGQRLVREQVPVPRKDVSLELKKGGVYLITGGAGGLGLLLAEHMLQTHEVDVIITGRRETTEAINDRLSRFPRLHYKRCDVTDHKQLAEVLQDIKQQHGSLTGLFHAAGIIEDTRLVNKRNAEAEQVIRTKTDSLKWLDELTSNEPLDFILCYSSLSAETGNVGQSDYAFANAYMDDFVRLRNEKVKRGERHGKTISINWPLWEQGNMMPDTEVLKRLSKRYGLSLLPTSAGLSVMAQALSSNIEQLVVVYGNRSVFEGKETSEFKKSNHTVAAPVLQVMDDKKALYFVRNMLAEELRMEPELFEPDVPFEKYGIDSMMITRLTNKLEAYFNELSGTVFFEYQTLRELVNHLVKDHADDLQKHLSDTNTSSIPDTTLMVDSEEKEISQHVREDAVSVCDDIAIIGLSGRYPGADDLETFWENLRDGKDAITEIPSDRWALQGFYNEGKGVPGKSYSKWGGFLNDVDKFDPLFFNISPKEAEAMDPQERLFLMTAWAAMEDAGYTRQTLSGAVAREDDREMSNRVGVFAGVMYEEYQLYSAEERLKDNHVNTGASPSSIANRVSYILNLHGPSMAIDTMCSSSLTAIHLACQSIRSQECEMALAGGVNVSVHPNKYIMLSQNHFVSSEGKCASFGEGGEGYVPAEGVGVVVLKPLQKAVSDGDHIYAIIKGSALNHGGKTNGYTVPNPNAQAAVIRSALKRAGVKPEAISYIEAHGTGTSLGDPIEITGLVKGYGMPKSHICRIGSVKSNIGHAESAAGISGLTKILLQLKHRQIVPSLHSEQLNPVIKFERTPFRVQQKTEYWPTDNNAPRIAAISSFGAGGSNAHVLISEFLDVRKSLVLSGLVVIILSARNAVRLKEYVKQLLHFIDKQPELNLISLAYTLQFGREEMMERLAIVVKSLEELKNALNHYLSGNGEAGSVYSGTVRKAGLINDVVVTASENKLLPTDEHQAAKDWVKGASIHWEHYYTNGVPLKISLPTYPFAKDRYWITIKNGPIKVSDAALFHPLLHETEPGGKGTLYLSRFTGRESFFTDHVVMGQKVLPGVAYLEIAMAAVVKERGIPGTTVQDVVWLKPLVANHQETVLAISINVSDSGYSTVRIGQRETESPHFTCTVHSNATSQVAHLDIDVLKGQFTEQLSGNTFYTYFNKLGILYGPSFQGVQQVWYTEKEALSRIEMPLNGKMNLQLGALDSALQTIIALYYKQEVTRPALPFSIKRLVQYASFTSTMWCYVKQNPAPPNAKINDFDIQLLNDNGQPLLSIQQLTLLQGSNGEGDLSTTSNKQGIALKPVVDFLYKRNWQRLKVQDRIPVTESDFLLVTTNPASDLLEVFKSGLRTYGSVTVVSNLSAYEGNVRNIYMLDGLFDNNERDGFPELKIFTEIKNLLDKGYGNTPLQLTVYTRMTQKVRSTDVVNTHGSGIIGLMGSLAKEQPLWNIRVIDLETPIFTEKLISTLLTAPFSKDGSVVACRNGFIYSHQLNPVMLQATQSPVLKRMACMLCLGVLVE